MVLTLESTQKVSRHRLVHTLYVPISRSLVISAQRHGQFSSMPIFVCQIRGEETMAKEGTHMAAPQRRGGRNVSRERCTPLPPPLTTPFLLHDLMEEVFPASMFLQGQALLFQVSQNLITMAFRGGGGSGEWWKLSLLRCNTSGK